MLCGLSVHIAKSLSARRAWIEIAACGSAPSANGVALRKESVDRNYKGAQIWTYWQVALRKESVDRNAQDLSTLARESTSLSARRAWIEIFYMGI